MRDMRINLRERHPGTGAVGAIEKNGTITPSVPGFPAQHWEAVKRLPRFQDDSGRFISESRDRG